jgi:predicted ATP-grasp superfamily ATP-dependent carboligase
MPINKHRDWDLQDPLVLVGFPSQGLVGAIVASYLVPKLDMQLVATLDHPTMPPVASIREGRAHSPVQIFASTVRCGINGNCDQLVVIRSDAAPPTEHVDEISDEILEYADQIGGDLVVTLEGAPTSSESDHVFAVPNLVADVDTSEIGAESFPDGALSGFSASLLTEGNSRQQHVLCLFTTVQEDMPDAEAASRLVDVADDLVPGIRMDPEPLREEARKFERNLRAALEEQERSQEDMPSERTSMMYG